MKSSKDTWRCGEQGSALPIVIWVTLIISTLLFAMHNRLSLDRMFYGDLQALAGARQSNRDLFQYIILYLQQDESKYDIAEDMVFPLDQLPEQFSGVEVELWDEGSKLNPNNVPLPLLSAYFAGETEIFNALQNHFFNTKGSIASDSVVRTDFFLSNAELKEVLLTKEKMEKGDLWQDLTVFSPAVLGLIDGEVLLSLLLRWGEEYDHTSALRVIDEFNRNRKDLIGLDGFNRLAAELHLTQKLEVEEIQDLLIMDGGINPNFISPRFLEALFTRKNNEATYGFYDLDEFRKNNPFTEESVFEYYLQTLHNIPIAQEELWKIFTLETKIWGVRIKLPVSGERYLETSAILRRERDELNTSSQIRVLSYKEETKIEPM